METIHNQVSAAKEIKAILAKKWPSVKFSVTSDSYSMGCSIDVRWMLGPKQEDVERIANRYQYGWFDGMTDCYNHEPTVVLTDKNEFKELGGAKYVMCNRDYPNELREQFCKDICALQNVPYDGPDTNVFGEKWNRDSAASTYFWRVFCQTDFVNVVYDGVEYDESDHRKEFVKIKTRPLTAKDKALEQAKQDEKAQAARTKKQAEKAASDAMYAEIRAYWIKKIEEAKPDAHIWNSYGMNWRKAQASGRVLSQLEKEGMLKLAYISTNNKKVYKKA